MAGDAEKTPVFHPTGAKDRVSGRDRMPIEESRRTIPLCAWECNLDVCTMATLLKAGS